MGLNTGIKYLIFGNAQSVHLIKWIKALSPLCDLYVISSTTIHPDLNAYVDKSKCFSLMLTVDSSGGNSKILKSLCKVNKIISKIQPAIVNAHYITSHGLIASIIKRFSSNKFTFVSSAWGSDILVTPQKNIFYRLMTQFILNTSAIITSDAEVMTEEISKLSKTRVLTFTFGLEEMPKVSVDEKDYNVFFSNRILSPNYNIDKIIQHFASIYHENKNVKLIIANKGEEKAMLMELCNELNLTNVVEFRGFLNQKEQADLYRISGFYYSLPSSDATSVSLLEAMAWGCIPVVSDIPANREWIENNTNGIIVSAFDAPFPVEILSQKEKIMEINRAIILKKAIFAVSIKMYFEELLTLINTKRNEHDSL